MNKYCVYYFVEETKQASLPYHQLWSGRTTRCYPFSAGNFLPQKMKKRVVGHTAKNSEMIYTSRKGRLFWCKRFIGLQMRAQMMQSVFLFKIILPQEEDVVRIDDAGGNLFHPARISLILTKNGSNMRGLSVERAWKPRPTLTVPKRAFNLRSRPRQAKDGRLTQEMQKPWI